MIKHEQSISIATTLLPFGMREFTIKSTCKLVNDIRENLGGQWDFSKHHERVEKKIQITIQRDWIREDVYEGEVINLPDLKQFGRCCKIYSTGDLFEGWVKDGKRSGKGRLIKSNGWVYEGTWIDDH